MTDMNGNGETTGIMEEHGIQIDELCKTRYNYK